MGPVCKYTRQRENDTLVERSGHLKVESRQVLLVVSQGVTLHFSLTPICTYIYIKIDNTEASLRESYSGLERAHNSKWSSQCHHIVERYPGSLGQLMAEQPRGAWTHVQEESLDRFQICSRLPVSIQLVENDRNSNEAMRLGGRCRAYWTGKVRPTKFRTGCVFCRCLSLYYLFRYIEFLGLVKYSRSEINRRGILIPVSCHVTESLVSRVYGSLMSRCLVVFQLLFLFHTMMENK